MSSVPSSCPPTPAISGSASENGSILPLSRSSDVERATLPLTTAISSANSAVGESGSQPVSWRLLQPRTHPLSFRMIRWAEVCLHSLFLRRTWWIGEQSSPQLLTHPLSSWMLRWVEAGPRIHPLSPRGYGGGAVSQAAAKSQPRASSVISDVTVCVVCLHSLFRQRTWWIEEGSSSQLLTRPLSSRLIRPVEVVFLLPLHPLSPRWIRW